MWQLGRSALGTGLVIALVATFGCGSGGPKSDKLIVKGKVTIDDKAGEGITLSFYGPADKAASGVVNTQADGSYEVMFNSAAGEGNYKVTASKISARPGMQPREGIDDYQLKLASGGAAANALPAKYADVSKSGLSTPLMKGLNEGKNFALKSK
ncbi:MAG: hypothetical protein ACRC33_22515 [Gemmataceae bacterium]